MSRLLQRAAGCTGAGALAWGALALVPAPAFAAPIEVVGSGEGLTAPSGIAQTPDGALWVADDSGVCRVRPGDSPVRVADAFCGESHAGPVKATGLVFDPVARSFFVGDSSSDGGAVWRLDWDAGKGTIAGGSPIVRLAADRVSAVALMAPDDATAPADVLYATKDSSAVMRLPAPGRSAHPAAPVAVGHAVEAGPASIAHLDGRIYIADGADVTRLDPAVGGPAERIPGFAGGVPGALVADAARGRVYAGTANGLRDQVDVLDTADGTQSSYERSFTGVTSLAVDSNGDLLVADDPGEAAGILDAEGHGRLWRVALHALRRPAVRVDVAPSGVSSSDEAVFGFSADRDAIFECRLDGGDFSPCGDGQAGTITYPGLSDGVHAFEVRAGDFDPAVGAGLPARRVFVVDTRAPRTWISSSRPDSVFFGDPVGVELLADEFAVDFECSLDGAEFRPCDSSPVIRGLSLGDHEFRVIGTDAAGNRSQPLASAARWRFATIPVPEAPAPVLSPSAVAPVAHDVAPDPDPAAAPAPSAKPPALASAGRAPAGRPGRVTGFNLGSARLDRPRGGGASRLHLRLRVPAGARRIRIALERRSRPVAVRRVRVRAGVNRLELRLTRAETSRLRAGVSHVKVALLDDRGRRGEATVRRLRIS